MARRDDDDNDAFQEKRPPAKADRPRDEGVKPAKPRAARSSRDDDDYDDRDDRERRRDSRPPRRRDRDDDGVATIIPYRNGMALAGYYCGVFSLIPLIGALLGILAVIFGIVGLRRVSRNPEAKGTGHAITAIVLGGIGALYNWGIIILFLVGILMRR